MTQLEEVALTIDELEALRLADLEGLYHDDAAERMGVSRATFGRIVDAARRKVAEALVRGKALKIGGGAVAWAGLRHFKCGSCLQRWSMPYGTGRPEGCPSCGGDDFRRTDGGPSPRRSAAARRDRGGGAR